MMSKVNNIYNSNKNAGGQKLTAKKLNEMMRELVLEKLYYISSISNKIIDKQFNGHFDMRGERHYFLKNLSAHRAWIFGSCFTVENIVGDEVSITYRRSDRIRGVFHCTIKLSQLDEIGSDRNIAKNARKTYYEFKHDTLVDKIVDARVARNDARDEIAKLEKKIANLDWVENYHSRMVHNIKPLYDHHVNGKPLLKDRGSDYEKHKKE